MLVLLVVFVVREFLGGGWFGRYLLVSTFWVMGDYMIWLMLSFVYVGTILFLIICYSIEYCGWFEMSWMLRFLVIVWFVRICLVVYFEMLM